MEKQFHEWWRSLFDYQKLLLMLLLKPQDNVEIPKLKGIIKNQEIKTSFIFGPPFINEERDKLLSKLHPHRQFLCILVFISYIFQMDVWSGSPITNFQVLQISIISFKDINLLYVGRVYFTIYSGFITGTISEATKKGSVESTFFFKKILEHFFNEIKRGNVQKPDAIVA